MKSRDDILLKLKEEYDIIFNEKVKMMNLYFNNILSIKEKKEFKYINSVETSKHFNTCYLIIKDFWKELYNNKEMVYKIMKFSKKDELISSYLNIFFMQNFYINLFSYSDGFPNELYYLIHKLLKDIISRINTSSEYSAAFDESVLSYLFDGMVLNDNVRSFFNLILSDIIEQYENSKESIEVLLFKVKDIKDYFKNQEEKIKQEYLTANKPKKSEIEKQTKRQKSFLTQIYRMKLPNIKNNEKLNENIIDLEDIIERDYKNNEVFANKYLPELNKKELIELVNKEENDTMKNYISYQINVMNNDISMYSNKKFLENIQKCSESEKILYFYQKNFMISINIIKQIFQKLNENINLVPEEIKFISYMIKQSLKEKFNSIKNNEIYAYVSEFFIRIFKAFFLHPDYNALITSIILSKYSKDNFKKINDIIRKMVSGSFYKSTKEECDYTPYNLFFLEIMPEIHKFCEKLVENETFKIKMENLEKNQDLNHMKKSMNSNTIVYNIHQITSILNIINHNYNNFFGNNETDEFLKIFKKLRDNKDAFNRIKQKEKEENKIFFFAYNEIIYSPKLLNIMNRNEDKYFKIEELGEDKTREEVNMNKIIRAKNLIFDLLYISPKLSKLTNISIDNKGKNTKEILTQLNKYYKGINMYNQNDDKKNNSNNNNNNNEKSKIPKEWYINALLVCLDNLDEDYSKNDYEKLYASIKEDINKSIKNYDFGELTKILKDLKAISRFKDIFIKLQEIYKDNMINIKIRDFIENEPIEIFIKFIYNNTNSNKVFNITSISNNLNISSSSIKSVKNNLKDKSLIKCMDINDFIKHFPNLSLIQQRQDIDLFLIEKEIKLSNGLNQYFNILKDLINYKFGKDERIIVFNNIQKYILIKIYDKIYPRESDIDDMKIFQKTILLSWVAPHHLKLDKTYLENFVPITTNYINQLDNEKSPNGKFNVINKIFNAINNVLRFNKGNSFSIDDIAPICEYCLIKAQPERLSSNIKYLQNFISNDGSDLRKMRFDILKICMKSIKEINHTKFEGVSEEEYNKLCNKARGGI